MHGWTLGESPSLLHALRLSALYESLVHVDRGSTSQNAELFATPARDGLTALDLLVAGRHEEACVLLGPGGVARDGTDKWAEACDLRHREEVARLGTWFDRLLASAEPMPVEESAPRGPSRRVALRRKPPEAATPPTAR
jgi:hypothetical protein